MLQEKGATKLLLSSSSPTSRPGTIRNLIQTRIIFTALPVEESTTIIYIRSFYAYDAVSMTRRRVQQLGLTLLIKLLRNLRCRGLQIATQHEPLHQTHLPKLADPHWRSYHNSSDSKGPRFHLKFLQTAQLSRPS
jgi:hypothetical protein